MPVVTVTTYICDTCRQEAPRNFASVVSGKGVTVLIRQPGAVLCRICATAEVDGALGEEAPSPPPTRR
jgi:hypothetical protein